MVARQTAVHIWDLSAPSFAPTERASAVLSLSARDYRHSVKQQVPPDLKELIALNVLLSTYNVLIGE